jgi:hypothetical protein
VSGFLGTCSGSHTDASDTVLVRGTHPYQAEMRSYGFGAVNAFYRGRRPFRPELTGPYRYFVIDLDQEDLLPGQADACACRETCHSR